MLGRMVEQYMGVVPQVLGEESKAWQTARRVGVGLLLLLEGCAPEQLPLVQAAAFYFASDEDAVPDVQGEDGFDDDAEVFNAVCHAVGRPYLVVT